MITKAEQPRLNYDYQLGIWYLITPVTLAPPQLALAVSFCKEVYRKRINGEGDPARRKRMKEAVEKLSASTVKQMMIGGGEKVLYHSDKL